MEQPPATSKPTKLKKKKVSPKTLQGFLEKPNVYKTPKKR
jgi:hypothetical protein